MKHMPIGTLVLALIILALISLICGCISTIDPGTNIEKINETSSLPLINAIDTQISVQTPSITPSLPITTANAINHDDVTMAVLGWSMPPGNEVIQPDEGYKFIMVDVVLANHRTEKILRPCMKLQDDDNQEYAVDSGVKSIPGVSQPFNCIPSGDRVRGQVIFQVLKASSDYVFICNPGVSSDADIFEVPLGKEPFVHKPPAELLTPDPDTHEIGDVIINGDMVFTVLGWESTTGTDHDPQLPEGMVVKSPYWMPLTEDMRYVVLDIVMVNKGQQVLHVSRCPIELKDITGQRYEHDNSGKGLDYLEPDYRHIRKEDINIIVITPGERVRGKVSFIVPQDIHDLIFSSSVPLSLNDIRYSQAYVALGQNPITLEPPAQLPGEQTILTHAIGEAAQVDNFMITVTGVTFSENTHNKDIKWVVIDFTGKNTGSVNADIYFLIEDIKDEMNQYYSCSRSNYSIDFNEDVGPGETVYGQWSFEVPEDMSEFILVLESVYDKEQRVFFSLLS